MRFPKPDGALSPADPIPQRVILWAVYGNPNFPHMCACQIKPGANGPRIWQYSSAEKNFGFVLNGDTLERWFSLQRMAYFFPIQDDALAFLRDLTYPRGRR